MPSFQERLVGYRIESVVSGVLRIRTRQVPLAIAIVLIGVMAGGVPLVFLAEALAGKAPLANLYGKPLLTHVMVWLSFALLGGIGFGSLWYWPAKEELLLSRVQGTVVRTTRNLFGLNARVRDRFSLPDSPRLRLWISRINNKGHLTPMLIDEEGESHALSLGSVLLWENREASQRYLKTLSDFLGRRWPAPKAPPTRTARAPRPSPPRVSAAAPSRSAGASMAPASSHIASASVPTKTRIQHRNDRYAPIEETEEALPEVSWPLRWLVGGVGLFFALFALSNAVGLIRGIVLGRLSVSFYQFKKASVYLWADDGWSFVWAVGGLSLELFLCVGVAYGCLRVFWLAPTEKKL